MNRLSYPFVLSFFAILVVALVSFVQYGRVFEHQKQIFLIYRCLYVSLMAISAIYFYMRSFDDLSGSVFMSICLSYVIVMMWYMPLYEAAYFEMTIGCAFLRFKRSWIFPVLSFIGFAAIVITYQLQDNIHWVLPPASRHDWVAIVGIFFGLSWAIQKFAITAHRKDSENLRRFGVIGRDAARLTHDLKGLLSSPMLILENLKNKHMELSPEFHERQMSLLIKDMEHVRETMKGIIRLAIVDEKIERIDINRVLENVLSLLERRLKKIEIIKPDQKNVMGNQERLHSVFFNLIINSLQAFEERKIGSASKIEIYWDGHSLILKDNAGGLADKYINGQGLGLELIRSDVQMMGAEFKIYSEQEFTFAEIKFKKSSFSR